MTTSSPRQASRAHGQAVEQVACRYLQQQGLVLVDSNFNSRGGELDLVMTDKDTLVFVEVRFRKSDRFGSPLESITASKRQKLLRTAQLYLLAHRQWQNRPCRFDVIAARPGESGLQFEWIQNAFGA
ncbi:MAG TPA: YraN family protein [Pseudomonadales bacterium]|nr:YraN family protein [Pseudomonadales bacterium]